MIVKHYWRQQIQIRYFVIPSLLVLAFLAFNSCASVQGQLYFVDRKTGGINISNEPNVKARLEEILCNPYLYNISVFERAPLRWQRPTRLWRHTFYVINNSNGEYHTLSFYGTVFTFYSEGAWAFDTDYDYIPYSLYLDGKNEYSVSELWTPDKIDLVETLKNIIGKIDASINGSITYYLLDHVNDKPAMDNCNTALVETLVLKDSW
jgi:hypothetical protein